MAWIIYRHLCTITNKSYIGQTKDSIEERAGKNGYRYKRSSPKFNHAIQKYGWNAFTHEILEENILDQKTANLKEQYWIAYYDTINNGYNILPGGQIDNSKLWNKIYQLDLNKNILNVFASAADANRTLFPTAKKGYAREIRKCCKGIRSNVKGFYFCFAKDFDTYEFKHAKYSTNVILQLDKNKQILNRFNTLVEAAELTQININHIKACCDKERNIAGNYFWCYEIDFDTYKIPERKDWPKAKMINQIDIQTNKIIHTYVSANIASKETGISRGNINTCCRGQLKSAGGYKWEFAENEK